VGPTLQIFYTPYNLSPHSFSLLPPPPSLRQFSSPPAPMPPPPSPSPARQLYPTQWLDWTSPTPDPGPTADISAAAGRGGGAALERGGADIVGLGGGAAWMAQRRQARLGPMRPRSAMGRAAKAGGARGAPAAVPPLPLFPPL
jgi:hypothetical protein